MTATAETVLTADTVTFTVTEAHIGNGKPRMACECPVALAILDAFPGAEWVMVGYSDEPEYARAWVRGPWGFTWLSLGLGGRYILRQVDAGEEIRPFTLTAQVQHG